MTADQRKLERARLALQVILTWATFEYKDLPRGHALDPDHIEKLCRDTLAATEPTDSRQQPKSTPQHSAPH